MKFGIMKLFRRSKDKKAKEHQQPQFNYDRDQRYDQQQQGSNHGYSNSYGNNGYQNSYGRGGRGMVFAPWLQLPAPLLQRVFAFVCPHSQDDSYETCEQSAIEDACMLCDLRDLAHAGMVCKTWRKSAIKMM